MRTHGTSCTTLPRASDRASFVSRIQATLDALETWLSRRRQRLDLAGLEDRLLADIGLTRADVARETAKPFWRP
jgi:uncharacterized protein YjiS (DUF1127 family)